MASIVDNDKGFKVVSLSHEEGRKLGWGLPEGFVCTNCNNIIEGDLYYICVLNDVMDKKCYENWLKTAVNYAEDRGYEEKMCKSIIQYLKKYDSK